MKGHEEDTCCFKLKAMQEAQRKTKQKAQQKLRQLQVKRLLFNRQKYLNFQMHLTTLNRFLKCKNS
jgi:hypothetical protein